MCFVGQKVVIVLKWAICIANRLWMIQTNQHNNNILIDLFLKRFLRISAQNCLKSSRQTNREELRFQQKRNSCIGISQPKNSLIWSYANTTGSFFCLKVWKLNQTYKHFIFSRFAAYLHMDFDRLTLACDTCLWNANKCSLLYQKWAGKVEKKFKTNANYVKLTFFTNEKFQKMVGKNVFLLSRITEVIFHYIDIFWYFK